MPKVNTRSSENDYYGYMQDSRGGAPALRALMCRTIIKTEFVRNDDETRTMKTLRVTTKFPDPEKNGKNQVKPRKK